MAKNINARIVQKIDSSTNWAQAKGFQPMAGEFFLVKDFDCPIVIGDGETAASELYKKPLFAPITNDYIDSLFGGAD